MNRQSNLSLNFLMNVYLSNLISNSMTKYFHFLKHVNPNYLNKLSQNVRAVWIRSDQIKMPKFVNFVVLHFVTNVGKRKELSQRKVDHLVGLKSLLKNLIRVLIQMRKPISQAKSGRFAKFVTENFLLNKCCKTITFRLNVKLQVY